MKQLPPANWVPNLNVTGGNMPPESLWITDQVWELTGRPTTMEEFYKSLRPKREGCCCSIIGCEHVV